jgi:hypothetical protein
MIIGIQTPNYMWVNFICAPPVVPLDQHYRAADGGKPAVILERK